MSFVCKICGETHEGLGAWAFDEPDHWVGLTGEQKAAGYCGSDACWTEDGHYFVRCVLELPLIDGPQSTFEFGVWGSLSEANYNRYVETFSDNDQSKLGPMFSYLSNEIRDFPGSFALKTNIYSQDERMRPLMEFEPTDHPLAIAQREGISIAKVLEIVHRQSSQGENSNG